MARRHVPGLLRASRSRWRAVRRPCAERPGSPAPAWRRRQGQSRGRARCKGSSTGSRLYRDGVAGSRIEDHHDLPLGISGERGAYRHPAGRQTASAASGLEASALRHRRCGSGGQLFHRRRHNRALQGSGRPALQDALCRHQTPSNPPDPASHHTCRRTSLFGSHRVPSPRADWALDLSNRAR